MSLSHKNAVKKSCGKHQQATWDRWVEDLSPTGDEILGSLFILTHHQYINSKIMTKVKIKVPKALK